jgi:hypothetical protein
LEHIPPFGSLVESVGLAAEEQREEQENMLRRFKASPVSGILKRTMEQRKQPEIILVPDESGSELGSASPKVSSEDSDSEMQLPDPEESNVVITGNGVEAEYDGPMWTVPSFPFRDHLVREPFQFPGWVSPANWHMFEFEGKLPLSWDELKDYQMEHNEQAYMAVERKRYEECSVAPEPSNDVIVGSVLVIWTENVTTTFRVASGICGFEYAATPQGDSISLCGDGISGIP